MQDTRAVLDTLIPAEKTVQTKDGCWYSIRILPYRTLENVIKGAVLAFIDVTELEQMKGLSRLAIAVRDSNDAITVQDFAGQILAWNPRAKQMYGWSEAEALAMNIRELVPKAQIQEAILFAHYTASVWPGPDRSATKR